MFKTDISNFSALTIKIILNYIGFGAEYVILSATEVVKEGKKSSNNIIYLMSPAVRAKVAFSRNGIKINYITN